MLLPRQGSEKQGLCLIGCDTNCKQDVVNQNEGVSEKFSFLVSGICSLFVCNIMGFFQR